MCFPSVKANSHACCMDGVKHKNNEISRGGKNNIQMFVVGRDKMERG